MLVANPLSRGIFQTLYLRVYLAYFDSADNLPINFKRRQTSAMLTSFITRIFGSRNTRVLRKMWKVVAKINALEPEISALSDEALQAKTPELRQRLADAHIRRNPS